MGLCVHHVNGVHEDDREENRSLLCRSCHAKVHGKFTIIKMVSQNEDIKPPRRMDVLVSHAEGIPVFERDVIDSLPDYYRALAERLFETGRCTIV